MKRIKTALGVFLLLLFVTASVSAADVSYREDKDVNEASSDDTMAYHIYIGKAVSEVDAEFAKRPGWEKRSHDRAVRMYRRAGGDYIENVYLYAHPDNAEVVGSYRISFFTRTKAAADDIYFNTTKNFGYILGRPSVKRGGVSEEWILNDPLKISVEYTEYDPRLPVAKDFPFEISVRRMTGDYSGFFRSSQATG